MLNMYPHCYQYPHSLAQQPEACACMRAKSLKSCPTLCNLMQPARLLCPWILQARILEWVVVPFSRESSQPWEQTGTSYVSFIGRLVIYQECYLQSPSLKLRDDKKVIEPDFELKSVLFNTFYVISLILEENIIFKINLFIFNWRIIA